MTVTEVATLIKSVVIKSSITPRMLTCSYTRREERILWNLLFLNSLYKKMKLKWWSTQNRWIQKRWLKQKWPYLWAPTIFILCAQKSELISSNSSKFIMTKRGKSIIQMLSSMRSRNLSRTTSTNLFKKTITTSCLRDRFSMLAFSRLLKGCWILLFCRVQRLSFVIQKKLRHSLDL